MSSSILFHDNLISLLKSIPRYENYNLSPYFVCWNNKYYLFIYYLFITVSIIPGPTSSGGQALTAANGGTIATDVERTLQLVFGDSTSLSHRFSFDFIQGQVDGPILGIDFNNNNNNNKLFICQQHINLRTIHIGK